MKIYDVINLFLEELFKEAMFIFKHLFIFLFASFVAYVLWKNGVGGRIVVIFVGVYLIGQSVLRTYKFYLGRRLSKYQPEISMSEPVPRELHSLTTLKKGLATLTQFNRCINKSIAGKGE